jgi:protocatechuate 3,4-dioxygenase, beta subunit
MSSNGPAPRVPEASETPPGAGPAEAAAMPWSQRRQLMLVGAVLAVPVVWRAVQAQGPLPLTPVQTEGPFYPVQLPTDTDADLLVQGPRRYAKGQAAWLDGQLLDAQGRVLRGGTVEIWQCDADGHYHHPGDGGRADPAFQGFGRATVDAEGRFRFRTMKPVAYSGRTPHIHVKVKLGARELLTTQLYVEGDAGNAGDGIWRRLSAEQRAAVTLPYRRATDGWQAQCRLVVQA